jgi:protein-L-isoaspartate(D-aspartate) O-methyltransferase
LAKLSEVTSMSRPSPDTTLFFEAERRAMVENQIRRRGVRDERVLAAMLAVPRHEFVKPEYLEAAYEDCPLPIGPHETISQPYIVAAMTAAARVSPGDKVLEVGTGSGYQSAILAQLGAEVTTIERNAALAAAARLRLERLGYAQITVIEGDGSEGYPPAAPYQAILVTAAAPQTPRPLLEQLGEGGRLVIPVGDQYSQDLELIFKMGGETSTQYLDPCMFVPLVGRYGWPGNR